jgi:hypothetical protein
MRFGVAAGVVLTALWLATPSVDTGLATAARAEEKSAPVPVKPDAKTRTEPAAKPGVSSPQEKPAPAAVEVPRETPADRVRQQQQQQQRQRELDVDDATKAKEDGDRAAQCAWLGRRIISLLIRDDAMAANDFTPFYLRFECPEDHLAEAFGCTVVNLPMVEQNAQQEQIESCWQDPSVRVPPPAAKPGGPAEPKPAEGNQKPN